MTPHYDMAVPPHRYVSTGPWRVAAVEVLPHRVLQYERFTDLYEAIKCFSRFQLPPVANRQAGVYDEFAQIIIGYNASFDGTTVHWAGTDEAFHFLYQFDPPEDVALYEAVARESLPPNLAQVFDGG